MQIYVNDSTMLVELVRSTISQSNIVKSCELNIECWPHNQSDFYADVQVREKDLDTSS